MKKLTALLLVLLLAGGISVTAYADDVTITTTVPERHTVEADGNPVPGAAADIGGNSPQTGDSSYPLFWFILLILSCTGLMGTIIYNRKKREE